MPLAQIAQASDTVRSSPTEVPHYAFLLGWPFESPGGVNSVLENLLLQFQTAGQCLPMAIEIAGKEAGAVSRPMRRWPVVSPGTISSWNPLRPWRSLIGFAVKAPVVLWTLRAMCRRYSIQVLNPHFIGLHYLPLLALRKLRLFRGKLILSFHGSDIRGMMQSSGLERRLSRMLLRGADILVACSEGLRDEILLFVPECAARTVVIHNGIDTAAFLSLSSEAFRLPDRLAGRKMILNIGAYEYKKGHDILLAAFAAVRTTRPDVGLVIAGQRSSAAIARLADELGIRDDVLLLENLSPPQILSLLRRADVFVLSSRWEKGVCGEGFAMALLEAGATGKPVISTRSCGVGELISDNDTGRLVPVNDPPALSKAIGEVLSNPADSSRMGQRLRRHVDTNFTWRQAYDKYSRL